MRKHILRALGLLAITSCLAAAWPFGCVALLRYAQQDSFDDDLLFAIFEGDHKSVERLATPKEVNRLRDCPFLSPQSVPLHMAAMMADPESMEILLSAGADPNQPDSYGFSPLMLLLEYSEKFSEGEVLECVDALLKHGADPSTPFPDGRPYWSKSPAEVAEDRVLDIVAARLREHQTAPEP